MKNVKHIKETEKKKGKKKETRVGWKVRWTVGSEKYESRNFIFRHETARNNVT